jgi:triacylglycerol lipase
MNSRELKMKSKPNFIFLFLTSVLWINAAAQEPHIRQLEELGPYQVERYNDFPTVPQFASADIYYPKSKIQTQQFGGVAISPGFREKKENLSWWGEILASHGFAVLILDTNTLNDLPEIRAEALIAGVNVLRSESIRNASPLNGKIKRENMAVMGHSMGGGGALLAAQLYGNELKAAIPLTSWQPDGHFSKISIPTLAIAGEVDRIAASDVHAFPHFRSLSDNIAKMYIEIKNGNHFIANTATGQKRLQPNIDVHDLIGRFGIAWLKLFLDEDESYRPLVFGDMPEKDIARISRWEFYEN